MKQLLILLSCILAQLSWAQSGEGFNPVNPGDPDRYYRLSVETSSIKGGSVYPSSLLNLSAGQKTRCSATSYNGYKFKQWMVGDKVVSTEDSFIYTMPEEDVTLIAYFDWIGNDGFDPANPLGPYANHFNKTTGELLISEFESGRLSRAIYSAIGTHDDYNKVKTIVVAGYMQPEDFGFLEKMTACSVVDLSRTTGYDNVPDYAFSNADALEIVILPHTVRSMGGYVFSGCERLTTMFCCAATPPIATSTTFSGVPSSMKVLAPSPSLTLYQSANYWNRFAVSALDGVEDPLGVLLPEAPDDFDKTGDVRAIYSVNGTKMTAKCLDDVPSGTYIIYSEKDGHTKVSKYYKGGSKK